MRNASLAAIVVAVFPGELGAETPLTRAELQGLCRDYVEAPASSEAKACEAYVLGYLDGLRSDAAIESRSPEVGAERESWSDRAARTRLGRAGIERARMQDHLCVPADAPVSEIIGRLLSFLDGHPHRREAPASEAVAETLRRHYTCG